MRRVYIGMVAVLVALLVFAEVAREEPIDWRYSFVHDDSRPYGGAVAWRLVSDWFDVERVTEPPFVRLNALEDAERRAAETAAKTERQTYFFLTDVFAPDAIETEHLLAFAERGHTVFVSAERIQGTFADTLGLVSRFVGRPENDVFDEDNPALRQWRWTATDTTLHLTSPALAQGRGTDGRFALDTHVPVYRYDRLGDRDTDATVLGTMGYRDWANFARFPFGEGQVLVHATPTVFSNAVLLADAPDVPDTGEAAAYLAAALAYLPNQPMLWDGYYKPGRALSTSPLRYVFESPALRGAYLTLLLAIVLYFLLRARRWQRAIPVVAPPPNAMAALVENVGRLYHEQGDTQALAASQRRVLLDRLRRRTHLDGLDLSPENAARVAKRLGEPEDEVTALFARLHHAETRPVSDDDLLALDRRLHALLQR
ncbi:MAG: DUF4350 domain-containing protein [Bacteroidota bacterium]